MALNDVNFVVTPGGLGRLPADEDHVSGIFQELAASPGGWANSLGKKYLSLEEAEADGIVETDANFTILWYHIREFFATAGASELYVIDTADADFTAQKVFNLTEGKLRQVYWYKETNYAGIAADVAAAKAFYDSLATLHAPCVFLLSVKDESTAVDGAGQADLRALNSEVVSVINSGDGSGKGKDIADSLGIKYVPAGGASLGTLALASVHENIGWVGRFNLQRGNEYSKVIFSDGQQYDAVTESAKDTLNTKGWIFLRKHVGIAGSYFNDSHSATAATSDFAYIENNRTIQKAKRTVRAQLLPQLNSPLTVDDEGRLGADTIEFFKNLAERPLEIMQAAGEVSEIQVIINPKQDVLATSKLKIQIRIIPRGVARTIEVNIGFTVSLN